MPDHPPPKTIGDALVMMMGAWNTPLTAEKALCRKWRFVYALAGSLPWVYLNIEGGGLNLLSAVGVSSTVFGVAGQLALAGWFAWLISFQDRRCAPSRFFLEGILFTGLAVVLLTSGQSLIERLVERG